MRERMLAGELYIADDAEIGEESARARWLIHQLNTADPRDAVRLHEILTGAVVVRDLEANAVAVGNPARVIRTFEA
jgi:hypothetical protein